MRPFITHKVTNQVPRHARRLGVSALPLRARRLGVSRARRLGISRAGRGTSPRALARPVVIIGALARPGGACPSCIDRGAAARARARA